jgi:hypothetical protein
MMSATRSEILVARFVEQITELIEREIEARARALVEEQLDRLASAFAAPTSTFDPSAEAPAIAEEIEAKEPAHVSTSRPSEIGRSADDRWLARIRKRAPAPAEARPSLLKVSSEPDPRDIEQARLRMLLRPAEEDEATAEIPAAATTIRSEDSRDPLRQIEDEMRDQIQELPRLSREACGAQIAAWGGRVRMVEEAHGNRVAVELLLEKLRALARAMEVGHIEALVTSWRTADWPAYIRRNEALASSSRTDQLPAVQTASG